jgi:hypothetical protein
MAMMLGVFILASCAKETNVEKVKPPEDVSLDNRTSQCDLYEYCTTILNPTYYKKSVFVEGCEIEVEFWVSECYDITKETTIIKFSDIKFKVKTGTAGCNTLLPPWGQYPGGDIGYNNLLNSIYKKVLDKIEADYMNSLYPSGSLYDVQYVESFCFKYCIKTETNPDGSQWTHVDYIRCGRSCCKRVTQYKRVPGNTWQKSITIVTGDPICAPMNVNETCGTKGTSLPICNPGCARL